MKKLFFPGFPLEPPSPRMRRLSRPRRVAANQQCSKTIQAEEEPEKNNLLSENWTEKTIYLVKRK